MGCCRHCTDAEGLFSRKAARRDLRRYRRRGPHAATRKLLRALSGEVEPGGVLIDVGGGIGAIQHELLANGLDRAVHVDASAAYLEASRAEAERRGNAERVSYEYGDFVELADGLPAADVVTLDRVVCCYPDMPRLVAASTAKSRALFALSYPRRRWATTVGITLANLYFRARGSAFRTYLHPPEAIAAEVRSHGFRPVADTQTFLWHVSVYRREPGA
jgi:2-polyprenyl-3-methyl-5-hydroxy-6-metoxy-1,4-benzoquinol methylase